MLFVSKTILYKHVITCTPPVIRASPTLPHIILFLRLAYESSLVIETSGYWVELKMTAFSYKRILKLI